MLPFGKEQLPEFSWSSLMWDVSGFQQPRPDDIASDVAFEILKNRRRRRTLKVLTEREELTTLSELAEEIAAWENGIDRQAITSDQRKRVYVGLYQQHLPKMDDAGVIEFDQRSGETRLTDAGHQLWQWRIDKLQDRRDNQDSYWPKLYFSIGVVGLGMLAGTWLQLIPSIKAMTVPLSVFLLVAVAHACLRMLPSVIG